MGVVFTAVLCSQTFDDRANASLFFSSSVNNYENQNKMTLHNLATVFGPTLVRPGSSALATNFSDQFAAGTVDVMAQAGILLFFLERKTAEVAQSCL